MPDGDNVPYLPEEGEPPNLRQAIPVEYPHCGLCTFMDLFGECWRYRSLPDVTEAQVCDAYLRYSAEEEPPWDRYDWSTDPLALVPPEDRKE